jgi:hypothetical protein
MEIACHSCEIVVDVPVKDEEFQAWKGGQLIQDAMPSLNKDEREMLMSGTCVKCWDDMFGEDDEQKTN